jgi:hypothetical protein
MLADLDEVQTRGLRVVLAALAGAAGVAEAGVGIYALVSVAQGAAVFVAALGACLLLSAVFRGAFVYSAKRESALEFLQQPCRLRAAGQAATAPLQIFLVAWVVQVRDARTLGLLICAQGVGALLMLAAEVAHASSEVEEAAKAPAAELELGVGTMVRGPQADPRLMATHRENAVLQWREVMLAAGVLHAAVWTVLLGALVQLPSGHGVLLLCWGQFCMLTLLVLVPVAQKGLAYTGAFSVQETFVSASVLHAVMDIVAKALLMAAFLMPD